MDADYVVTSELLDEIAGLTPSGNVAGYRVPFAYCIHGYEITSSLYPARVVLYRRAKAVYHNEGHGHKVAVDGEIVDLRSKILHDDRKPLSRWLSGQVSYALNEADYLLNTPAKMLKRVDRLRLWILPAPLVVMVYTLLRLGLRGQGWRGWFYVIQRTLAELLLSLCLLDRKLRP
jgi:hypothetical protein